MSAPSFYSKGGVRRQCREMGGEIGENEHNFHCVHFCDALAGPPPVFIPPQILHQARMSHLHPSGKGRAGACLHWLGPLVIVTWFVMLGLGRGGHCCWVGYVVVGLNSLLLGLIHVVAPYLPSLS